MADSKDKPSPAVLIALRAKEKEGGEERAKKDKAIGEELLAAAKGDDPVKMAQAFRNALGACRGD